MLKEAIKYSLQYKGIMRFISYKIEFVITHLKIDYSENTNPNETAKYLVNIINEDNFISGTRLVFKKWIFLNYITSIYFIFIKKA